MDTSDTRWVLTGASEDAAVLVEAGGMAAEAGAPDALARERPLLACAPAAPSLSPSGRASACAA